MIFNLQLNFFSHSYYQMMPKKREKIVKSKCSNDQILKKKDDEADDQGNPSKGRGHVQSKG